jgi:hypothetical protein
VSEGRGSGPWIVGALAAALAIGVAVWRLDAPAPEPPAATVAEARPEPAPQAPAPGPELPLQPAAESYRIAERGRIAISSETLTPGVPVVFDLDLREEARGGGVRPVRLVGVDGRAMDATSSPGAGGVRLEVDPEWLLPGRYMIEVRTAEKTHFPAQRYVLEVR